MRSLAFLLISLLMARAAHAQAAEQDSAEIRRELETAAEAYEKGALKAGQQSPLPDMILKRGYVEGKLLRAQDSLIQDIETGRKRSGASTIAFLSIHTAMLAKCGLPPIPDNSERLAKCFFPIVKDKSYSWHLRAHYLSRADAFRRDRRGEKTPGTHAFRNKLLALAKELESDESDSPELRAEALGIIQSMDLDDGERRRLVRKHFRSKNEALRKKALFYAVQPANLSDEILEDVLQQYEDRDSEPDSIRRELHYTLIRIGQFSQSPDYQARKATALRRLEQLKQRATDSVRREEIDDLIDDMTRDPKERKRKRGSSQEKK